MTPPDIFKLLNEVKIVAGSELVEVNSTLPIPAVKTLDPEFANANPLQINLPPLVILIEPTRLLLPAFPKEIEPEAVSWLEPLKLSAAVPEPDGDKNKEAQTALLIFTTTDCP